MNEENLSLSDAEDLLTATLSGEIDHHSAIAIRTHIDEALFVKRPELLVIDIGRVDFMDSSGLGRLMGRLALMKKLGGRMVLYRPTLGALRMVHLAGMERLIVIEQEDV